MSHQPPTIQKKSFGNKWWLRNQHLMKGTWYHEKSKKVNYEGRWLGIFQHDREESTYLKKKYKGWGSQKGVWKVSLEALEREIKVIPIRTPQKRKFSWELFGGKSQKKNTMRNKERTNHQCCWHNTGFGTQGNKGKESMAYWKPYEGTIKGESSHQQKSFSNH